MKFSCNAPGCSNAVDLPEYEGTKPEPEEFMKRFPIGWRLQMDHWPGSGVTKFIICPKHRVVFEDKE